VSPLGSDGSFFLGRPSLGLAFEAGDWHKETGPDPDGVRVLRKVRMEEARRQFDRGAPWCLWRGQAEAGMFGKSPLAIGFATGSPTPHPKNSACAGRGASVLRF
jgi:hypothetical protein